MSGSVTPGFHKSMNRLLVAVVIIYVVTLFGICITLLICMKG